MWIITVFETKLNLEELVGIYDEEQKQKDNDDLVECFLHELKFFITNGITFEDKKYKVAFHWLVSAAPTESYVLKLKLRSGYCSTLY